MTPPADIRVWWTCDHCRHRGRVDALSSDTGQDLADRCTEAHAIADPDCHTNHADTGVRINATGAEPGSLWEI